MSEVPPIVGFLEGVCAQDVCGLSVSIIRNGTTVWGVSVQAVRELATDEAGYHIA
jgi:hypothetical protein